MTFFKWSKTAASNGTADSTCSFPEGMAPSALNDGNRGMMAAAAKYRDDIAGAIVTGGTSTAYTVSSNQVFDSLAHLDGNIVAFTPHTTNTAGSPNVTLNVDSLGAKSIQVSPSVELPAGVLVAGTPYVALYNATNGVFYLHNFFGNPYIIPIGGSLDFWGSSAPNSSFALMYGQPISRTTYAVLFSLLGTTYGTGDGSTTFNIPDLRGRVVAGKDDMGGSAASRLTSSYFGTGATTLGGVGSSSESATLSLAQLPTGITSVNTNSILVGSLSDNFVPSSSSASSGSAAGGGNQITVASAPSGTYTRLASAGTISPGSIATSSSNTSGSAHSNVQPTIIGNKLLRLI